MLPTRFNPFVLASGIISSLIIIGSIFVILRVKKINSHINGKDKLPFGIKLPLYITITHCFIAVMNIIDLVNKGRAGSLCIAIAYLMPILVSMNLVLGVTIASQTWKVVRSNTENCGWSRGDFVLWIMMIFISFIYTFFGLTHYVPGWCMMAPLPFLPRTIDFVIIMISLALTFYSWMRITLRLNKLDSSVQYIFHIDDIKKIKDYILVFICQWLIITIYFIFRANKIVSSGNIYTWAIATGGLVNIIVFIKNEGFFFNPDSVMSHKQEEKLNDLEQKDIQSVKQASYSQA